MTNPQYPRSPKVLLGGIAHLGRFIDKVRLRHAGKIPDYNCITVGFDDRLSADRYQESVSLLVVPLLSLLAFPRHQARHPLCLLLLKCVCIIS